MSESSNPVAVIDSVVHGSQSVLSFRELSALLSVPLHTAQAHLTSYVTAKQTEDDSKLNVLWHVTNVSPSGLVRTSLTANPSKSATTKKVWAVAAPNTCDAPAVWFQTDRNRDLAYVRESTHQPNALRDGRFLPVVSTTSSWDARPDPRFGDVPMPKTEPPLSTKRKPSALLQSVKQPKHPVKRAAPAKSAFKQPSARQNGSANSLFSTRRLGQDATSRMRAKQGKPEAPTKNLPSTKGENAAASKQNDNRKSGAQRREGKSNRRIQVIDSEDESGNDDKMDIARPEDDKNKENGGDDDDADSIQEMEQRALEKERSQEEQEELERELRDLTNEGDDEEPESPKLQEMDDDEEAKNETGCDTNDLGVTSPTKSEPESAKRSFRESFGLPEETRGARRIRKEVEEVVEENGYMVTRRVVKTFDENGNEVNCEDVSRKEVGLAESNETGMAKQASETPVKSKNNLFKSLNAKSAQKKENGKKDKTGSKPGPSSASKKTPKKKVKGNIMSYFGKKA